MRSIKDVGGKVECPQDVMPEVVELCDWVSKKRLGMGLLENLLIGLLKIVNMKNKTKHC